MKMVSEKYQQLQETGRVKLYENEGFNLEKLGESFEIMFDPELYSVTLHGSKEGKYIQVTNLQFWIN